MSRILIIDDDPTVRLSIELVLAALGFEAESVGDGTEGLARMRELPPDLVICDIMMPGLDGFQVLAAAQQEPRLARIPFIFLTSLADREAQRRGMSAGADDYLTKPFEPIELVDAIQARLRKVLAMGPDQGAIQAALARIRGLLDPQEQEAIAWQEQDPPTEGADAPTISPRTQYWLDRIQALFDYNNPQAILYVKDEICAKKQTIHATYLLSVLLFKSGDRTRGEAEYRIAHSILTMSAEPLRMAIHAASWQHTPNPYLGLRAKLLRLEAKLEALNQAWLS